MPLAEFSTAHSPGTVPGSHLTIDPRALSRSASRLRDLVPAAPPGPTMLDDATLAGISPDSGIGRFVTAVAAARRAQEERVAALGAYAGGAADALDAVGRLVGDADSAAAARFAGLAPEDASAGYRNGLPA